MIYNRNEIVFDTDSEKNITAEVTFYNTKGTSIKKTINLKNTLKWREIERGIKANAPVDEDVEVQAKKDSEEQRVNELLAELQLEIVAKGGEVSFNANNYTIDENGTPQKIVAE